MKDGRMISRYAIMFVVVTLMGAASPGIVDAGCTSPQPESQTSRGPTSGTAPDPAQDPSSPAATSTTLSTTTTTAPPTTTTALSPAEGLLLQMNLRQKAAQVLMLAISGTALSPETRALLAEGPPAGILLFERNVISATQLRAFTADLQRSANSGGSGIGLLIAVDQEGGPVQRIREGVPPVPAARSLGDGSSPEEAGLLAAETATSLLSLGVNMNLAPVADVVGDKTSFLYRRTYGAQPEKVASFVSAVTGAFTRRGLIAVVKHFPGHGSASGDTHAEKVVSDATAGDFETIHLPPFRAAIEAGAEGMMMSHVVASAYDPLQPASQSRAVVEGLLRDHLGFSGLVVTDDLRMAGAEAGEPGEAAVAALQAGCDLLISTGTITEQRLAQEAIVAAVQSGRLSSSRLDEAVLRVLALKIRHGITAPEP